jgi:PTH1 family peptidyl-tRNA hydrolase
VFKRLIQRILPVHRADESNDNALKYLIVGLGNIGAEYADTRHNIGFMVLDAFAKASNAVFVSGRYGSVAEVSYKGRKFVLLKPSTYMNLSGNAVRYWMKEEKIPVENVLVVVDDVALDLGTIRIRTKGSDGGHNGLKHITATLGHPNYARLRFGIGHDFPQGFQIDYVLGQWTADEKKRLPERIEVAIEAIKAFGTIGIERAMNQFNSKA